MKYTKDTNKYNIQALIKILNDTKQKDVLFYGAGVSRWTGFCAWTELLKNLGNLCCERHCTLKGTQCNEKVFDSDKCMLDAIKKFRESDVLGDYSSLMLAKYLKEILNDDYNDYMENYFSQKGEFNNIQESLLSTIAKMPFDSYITTNYEDTFVNILQNNCDSVIKPYNYHNDPNVTRKFIKDVKSNNTKAVLFIHGKNTSSESYILDIDDYKKAYNIINEFDNSNQYIKKIVLNIAILLNQYNITYLGFSMNDPAIKMIQKLNFKLNIEFKDGKRNFIILPCTSEEDYTDFEDLENNCGLKVIYYEVENNQYEEGLLKFLQNELRFKQTLKPVVENELPDTTNKLERLFNERGTM